MKHIQIVLFVLCLCGMVLGAEFPEPALPGKKVPFPTFGDARSVALLGGLLSDPDMRVRERAAVELGQTHNPAALKPLQRAVRDPSPAVRAAAVRGAAELGPAGKRVVLAGLNDKHDAPRLAAMRAVVSLKLIEAARTISILTRHEREFIRYSALQTLTNLAQTVGNTDLKRLLHDSSPAVRLEALRNAMLLKSATNLTDVFTRLAEPDNPAVVRAAAVECLGMYVLTISSEKIEAASTIKKKNPAEPWSKIEDYAKIAETKNPLLRRAVVRVYAEHKRPADIVSFLSDPSPMVRLAAVEALVNLPDRQALPSLVKRFLSTPDEKTHNAARRALQNLGGELAKRNIRHGAVGEAMAEHLSRIMTNLKTHEVAIDFLQKEIESFREQKENNSSLSKKEKTELEAKLQTANENLDALRSFRERLRRNAMSCCCVLGVLRSKEGFDDLLRLTVALPLDSPILGELAEALGRIGDPRAKKPLRRVLATCEKRAGAYLTAMMSMSAPPPFSEENTGKIIQALVKLGDRTSTKTILRLTKLQVMTLRLGTVISYVLEVTPTLAAGEKRDDFEKFVLGCLTDNGPSMYVQWQAIRLAGKMKLPEAIPDLKNILYEQRKCPALITAAAWAIQKITGEQPRKIPPPQLREGDWILTQINP